MALIHRADDQPMFLLDLRKLLDLSAASVDMDEEHDSDGKEHQAEHRGNHSPAPQTPRRQDCLGRRDEACLVTQERRRQ
jgi:hypothetical protein